MPSHLVDNLSSHMWFTLQWHLSYWSLMKIIITAVTVQETERLLERTYFDKFDSLSKLAAREEEENMQQGDQIS